MSLVDRAKSLNTLICLLQGLERQFTTIELRNECSVYARIDSVDGSMNVHLSEVQLRTVFGREITFDYLYLQGKNIRYVHIPEHMNVVRTVEREIRKNTNVRFHTERKEKRLSKWNKKLQEARKQKRQEEASKATEAQKSEKSEVSEASSQESLMPSKVTNE